MDPVDICSLHRRMGEKKKHMDNVRGNGNRKMWRLIFILSHGNWPSGPLLVLDRFLLLFRLSLNMLYTLVHHYINH